MVEQPGHMASKLSAHPANILYPLGRCASNNLPLFYTYDNQKTNSELVVSPPLKGAVAFPTAPLEKTTFFF
jgi:hypothetical protein